MDRDDARLVVRALRARIDRDGDTLDALARSEMVRLALAAGRIKALSESWPPALIAVAELEEIGKRGRFVLEDEMSPSIGTFVAKLEELIAADPESVPVARNRRERRHAAARSRRIVGVRKPRLIGMNKPTLVSAGDPIE